MDYQGLMTCARYALPPNLLHYCGPEKQNDLKAYSREVIADRGLEEIITEFKTLFPYLKLIASENKLKDPFDRRVVEAYWLGNRLLDNVSLQSFYYHLLDDQKLSKKIPRKRLQLLLGKIAPGALANHAFHVLNVFTRTGHVFAEHTLATMDACRIGWGRVMKESDDGTLLVKAKSLIWEKEKLTLGPESHKIIETGELPTPKIGKWVAFHWGKLCEVLRKEQVANLSFYTLKALNLANQQL